jgi:hypothetical protein
MNAGYISAFAALAGSLIGGLTTFAAAWVTQRQQANVQWLLQEKTRRQELYQQFIEEASKLYVDALIHDQAEIPPFVSLYALIKQNEGRLQPRHRRTGRQSRSNHHRHLCLTKQVFPRGARDDGKRRAGPFARLQRGLPRRTFSSLFPSLTIRISSRVNRSNRSLRSRVCADRS